MKKLWIRSTYMSGKKKEIFRSKNQGETWEQKQDLHCKTGMNLAYKMATKTYSTVWHCICKRHHDNKAKKVTLLPFYCLV